MATSKAAIDICASSAACRAALENTMAKFKEAIEAVPAATIRRKLKGASFEIPNLEIAAAEACPAKPAANGDGTIAGEIEIVGFVEPKKKRK